MCVCLSVSILLPAAVCCLLVLHPTKFVLDKVNAAAEEEQSAVKLFTDAFRVIDRKRKSTG